MLLRRRLYKAIYTFNPIKFSSKTEDFKSEKEEKMVKKLLFAGCVVMSLFACFAGNTWAGDATLTLDDNAGSSSFVVQDSDKTNQFKVNSDGQGYFAGKVGIGTTAPQATLHVGAGNIASNPITPLMAIVGAANSVTPQLQISSPSDGFSVISYTPSTTVSGRRLNFAVNNDAVRMVIDGNGNVGIGTTNPEKLLVLAGVNDPTIRGVDSGGYWTQIEFRSDANDVFFTSSHSAGLANVYAYSYTANGTALNVPDYVFENDYDLMSLDTLRNYVKHEKHLPNMPTAGQIKDKGVNISQFQMRLLEKIEELTLYTLDQHEQIEKQQKQIQVLRDEISELKKVRSGNKVGWIIR